MTLEKIKQAVREGLTVHWSNTGYIVTRFERRGVEYWYIKFTPNGHSVGLTSADGALQGKEEEFYIA